MNYFSLQWAFFGGQGDGWFEDIDFITMFADYRVPQVLVHFGAMSYDEHLMGVLKEGEEIYVNKIMKHRIGRFVSI